MIAKTIFLKIINKQTLILFCIQIIFVIRTLFIKKNKNKKNVKSGNRKKEFVFNLRSQWDGKSLRGDKSVISLVSVVSFVNELQPGPKQFHTKRQPAPW